MGSKSDMAESNSSAAIAAADSTAVPPPQIPAPVEEPLPGFDESLPAFQEYQHHSGETEGLLLPDYFDISIVPEENVLWRTAVQPMTASTASVSRNLEGVSSSDAMLDSNPDELFRFFLTHLLEKPTLMCHISGTHNVTRRVHETFNGQERTRTETKTVTDFSLDLDLSQYVMADWDRAVAVKGGAAAGRTGQWRDVLEEFTLSKNSLKEIHLLKMVDWDFGAVIFNVGNLIRSTGYPHRINITFPSQNEKISVYSSSELSAISRNMCVRVLCVLSCLWIIGLPLWLLARQKINGKLFAYYKMSETPHGFYLRNAHLILNAVLCRAKNVKYIAL